MHLRHIKVSDYRVLRDVELSFGADFKPQIFPLGSKNGGGKSTLLQLIFVLLQCSTYPSRREYIRNLLSSFVHPAEQAEKHLASITLDPEGGQDSPQGNSQITLEFVSLNDHFLAGALGSAKGEVSFEGYARLPDVKRKQVQLAERSHALKNILEQWNAVNDASAGLQSLREVWYELVHEYQRLGGRKDSAYRRSRSELEMRNFAAELKVDIEETDRELREVEEVHTHIGDSINRVQHLLAAKGYLFITWFAGTHGEYAGLICRAPEYSPDDIKKLLQDAAERVFLLGPSMQLYLFLPIDVRKAFTAHDEPDRGELRIRYQRMLSSAEEALAGFHGYDWLSVKPMLALFRKARDLDFKQAVETGEYGQHYTSMLAEVNALLYNKRVKPQGDLSGITFTIDRPGEPEIPIGMEDLSRGELKRLMIYAWLKASRTDGAIMLMDEIEVSFHPDWQVGIVEDLSEWGPRNQYILATHSYELCEALTPAHVRELEPRLATRESPDTGP